MSPLRQRGFVLIGLILAGLVALALLAALVLGLAAAWYWNELPPLDKATDYRPRQHLQVLTADGAEIAKFGTERRIFVPIAQTPKRIIDALLAVEDTGFYEHGAISWRGLARATLANLTPGGTPQGASTITQQVARTFFLSTRRTAERKIKEALLAWQLESRLSKDQILELYMNQVYMGQRAYGFAAAAQVYLGKTLDQLTIAETAMVAGLPNNPIYANPVANFNAATRRQRWVLQRMRRTGLIDDAQLAQAQAEKIVLRSSGGQDVNAAYVAEMARRAVVDRLGEKAYTEGIRVITSLRADDQRAAHAALRRAVLAHERRQPWRGPEEQNPLPDDAADADRAASLVLKEVSDDEDLRAAVVLAASPREVKAKLASGETVVVKGEALKWVQAALQPQARDALAIRRGSVLRLQALPRGKAVEWTIAQWPEAEAAFVALDPVTGRIRALVGGFDFNRRQFNHVTHAARQPGSSFKPFLYAAAFENGVMPETIVEDAPLTDADGGVPNWNPKNSDDRFDGDLTVREGLVRSKNLVSIRLLKH
ncbi:MAG: transglycosylase domain-containing protein, partial [Rubrivivax sp.]|nr:transglycosylase domain-containing protein [Rubrivivax sp.]